MRRLLLTRIAKPSYPKTVGRTTILCPAYVGARVAYMAMIMSDEIPMGLEKPTASVVSRPCAPTEESEEAGWAELEKMALSGERLDALAEHFRSTGQASA